MPALQLEFEVFCANCGAGLCNNCTEGTTRTRRMEFIEIEPCEKCLSKAKDDGYDKGYEKGHEDAEKEAP